MTDNGSCYKAKDFATTCKVLGPKHIRTKPYTPRPTARRSTLFRRPCENGPMHALFVIRTPKRPSANLDQYVGIVRTTA
jgi:transposase InsO family protein